MRLLHVITNFEKRAGAEQALINLVESKLASDNAIVALRSDALARHVSLPATCRTEALGLPEVSLLRAARRLSSIAANYQPDAVLGWMYHGNLAASLLNFGRLRSPPVVWTVHHALDDWRSESRSTKLAIAASAVVSRTADAIVYVSARAQLQHFKLFGNNARSVVIPNAVPIATYQDKGDRAPGKTVGFAARYHPTKDFETFLRTVREVHSRDPSVRFLACGEGASMENSELAAIAKREGVQPGEIEWLGPRTEMAGFYGDLDLFLLTSRAEGFGMVLAEALGHGVPCVSTDVGAAREIIAQYGRVVPAGDARALAGAIFDELARPGAERQLRAKAAREHIAVQFSAEAVRTQYAKLLDGVGCHRFD